MKSHTLWEVTLFVQNTGISKGVNLEKQSPILRCESRAYRMNGSGLVCHEQRLLGYQTRRVRLVEAPIRDSTGGQTPLQRSQTQTPQGPSTSGLQSKGSEKPLRKGPSTSGIKPQEGNKLMQGPGKCQRSSGSTPKSGQAKRPRKNG